MSSAIPIILIFPLAKSLRELRKILEERKDTDEIQFPELEFYEIDNLDEVTQTLAIVKPALVLSSDAKKCAKHLVLNKAIIKSRNTKTLLVSKKEVPPSTIRKLEKWGLTDLLHGEVVAKTLAYKVDLILKTLIDVKLEVEEEEDIVIAKREEHEMVVSTNERNTVEKLTVSNPTSEYRDKRNDPVATLDVEKSSDVAKKEKASLNVVPAGVDGEKKPERVGEIGAGPDKVKVGSKELKSLEIQEAKQKSSASELEITAAAKEKEMDDLVVEIQKTDKKKEDDSTLTSEDDADQVIKAKESLVEQVPQKVKAKDPLTLDLAKQDEKSKDELNVIDIEKSNKKEVAAIDIDDVVSPKDKSKSLDLEEAGSKKKKKEELILEEAAPKKVKEARLDIEESADKKSKKEDPLVIEPVMDKLLEKPLIEETTEKETQNDKLQVDAIEEEKKKKNKDDQEHDQLVKEKKSGLELEAQEKKKKDKIDVENILKKEKKKTKIDIEEEIIKKKKNKESLEIELDLAREKNKLEIEEEDSSKKKGTIEIDQEKEKKQKVGELTIDESKMEKQSLEAIDVEAVEKKKDSYSEEKVEKKEKKEGETIAYTWLKTYQKEEKSQDVGIDIGEEEEKKEKKQKDRERARIRAKISPDVRGMEFLVKSLQFYREAREQDLLAFLVESIVSKKGGELEFFKPDSAEILRMIYPETWGDGEESQTLPQERESQLKETRIPWWSDRTFQDPDIEFIFPYYEGVSLIGVATAKFHKTIRQESDCKMIETALELARGYFIHMSRQLGTQVEYKGVEKKSAPKKKGMFSKLFGGKK